MTTNFVLWARTLLCTVERRNIRWLVMPTVAGWKIKFIGTSFLASYSLRRKNNFSFSLIYIVRHLTSTVPLSLSLSWFFLLLCSPMPSQKCFGFASSLQEKGEMEQNGLENEGKKKKRERRQADGSFFWSVVDAVRTTYRQYQTEFSSSLFVSEVRDIDFLFSCFSLCTFMCWCWLAVWSAIEIK